MATARRARWGGARGAGYDFFVEFVFGNVAVSSIKKNINKFNKEYLESFEYKSGSVGDVREHQRRFLMEEFDKKNQELKTNPTAQQRKNYEKFIETVVGMEKTSFENPYKSTGHEDKNIDFNDLVEPIAMKAGVYGKIKTSDELLAEEEGLLKNLRVKPIEERKIRIINELNARNAQNQPGIKIAPSVAELKQVLRDSGAYTYDEIAQADTEDKLISMAKKQNVYFDDITMNRLDNLSSEQLNDVYKRYVRPDDTKTIIRDAEKNISLAVKSKDILKLKQIKDSLEKFKSQKDYETTIDPFSLFEAQEKVDKAYKKLEPKHSFGMKSKKELAALISLKRGDDDYFKYVRMDERDLRSEALKEGFGLRNYDNKTDYEKALVISTRFHKLPSNKKDLYGLKSAYEKNMELGSNLLGKMFDKQRPRVISTKDPAILTKDLPKVTSGMFESLKTEKGSKVDKAYNDWEGFYKKQFPGMSDDERENVVLKEVYWGLRDDVSSEGEIPIYNRLVKESFALFKNKGVDELEEEDLRELAGFTRNEFKMKLSNYIVREKKAKGAYKLWPAFKKELTESLASFGSVDEPSEEEVVSEDVVEE